LDPGGIIVTAKGDQVDFVSRFFTPGASVFEDPVTGSAHCTLTPYWANELNKNKLKALQISERRGNLDCELKGDRVIISGQAVKYLEGKIKI
jgi:predicted PhzF superfamily epimerase YddE/YHI9